MPYWELKFDCVFPDLLRVLNENQPMTIQIGTGTQDLEPIQLTIKKPIIIPQTSSCSSVTLRGFTSIHSYLDKEFKQVYPDMTTKDLAEQMAPKYGLIFKSNISATNDKMTYYQPSISDYKFLFTEWLHSYLSDNDLIIPAINLKNEFTYNSLMQLIADCDPETMPTFVDNSPEKDEIQVDTNAPNETSTAFSNNFGNYLKERHIFDVDTGKNIYVNVENATPIISESKGTSVDGSISKSSGFYIQSSNVHKNYYKQELVNTQKFCSLQASKQWVSAPDKLIKNVSSGDLALFMTKKDNGQINDQTSGLYIVVKKVISIKERKVRTNMLLSRENMNYSKTT